jgi:spore coat protein U-like protein
MRIMQYVTSRLVISALGLALMTGANAATTITGQVTSTLVLTSSCQVNGTTASNGATFGTLNFGTANSLFGQADAQVLGGGGGAMSILCSSGTSPVIKVRAGSHDGAASGGTRALADGAGHFVPYDLYTDAGHSNLLAIDGTVSLATSTGTAQAVNIYGRATGVAGLPAGTYTDTIAVELTF